jgi:hypothetical protein
MTDILAIQQRIMALCVLIDLPTPLGTPIAVASQDECAFADDQIPVFEVRRGRLLRHDHIAADQAQRTREFIIRLFAARICDDTKKEDEAAAALAASCVDPVLAYFEHPMRRGLELNNDGGIVSDAWISQDIPNSVMATRSSGRFAGCSFRMQVVTRHYTEG